ncbi:p-aminobenzoyl-glutamate hydrolase subunit B [Clostridium acetireducens DSM 10703]|jgi:amidohydrolase|uniref:Peptidase M20 domain-containing protein 2 n=1 Tax=Clostridium acetireducens DSM 10703 TaxID=1121290 RepID=A0A1E8EWK9_9CLOT|nr:M20 family peptidase [Clostridium acetireducens]OFI01526.1 p-aminobenzoyl-glutamate hydrolase subunit B [Clostridium acetireducens DSM 10703]
MKQKITTYLNTLKDTLFNLSKYLYENPEDSFHEYKACNYITNLLKDNNFFVIDNYLNIPTAFYAKYGKGYPKICYICEYDAVENGGHIAGHNLVSAMSIGASLSLAKVMDKIDGTIIVLGCPGEFVGGAKVTMVKQGVFDDIDVVLMAHPDVITAESGTSRAVIPLKIEFKSKSGFSYRRVGTYSALDACLFTFNAISLLSKGFDEGCSIDGVIVKGGSSPYLLPSEAEAKFYIRAPKMNLASDIEIKIREFIKTTSNIMDVYSDISLYELPYDDLIPNRTLSRVFSHNLKESGIINIDSPKNTSSGVSLGTVSHKVPTMHPFISIVNDKSIEYSSAEFSMATISYYAQNKVLKAAKALALTGLDLIQNKNLLKEIKTEFNKKIETRD